MSGFQYIESTGAPIKAWTQGVPIEESAMKQLRNVASLPFIHPACRSSTSTWPSCPTCTGAWARPSVR